MACEGWWSFWKHNNSHCHFIGYERITLQPTWCTRSHGLTHKFFFSCDEFLKPYCLMLFLRFIGRSLRRPTTFENKLNNGISMMVNLLMASMDVVTLWLCFKSNDTMKLFIINSLVTDYVLQDTFLLVVVWRSILNIIYP